MPQNCALAKKRSVTKQDLAELPLICSRQAMKQTLAQNDFLDWFEDNLDEMNIIATYNLVFNAALLAEQGVGYVLTLDKLVDDMKADVCFRPLSPKLEAGLDIVWKKNQVFSPAAGVFLKALRQKFNS